MKAGEVQQVKVPTLAVLGTNANLMGDLGAVRKLASTWSAHLMHMMSNVTILTLLVDGYLDISRETEFLFTPSWEGIATMILITLGGLWLYRQRMRMHATGKR